jgi:hypothetical protein
MQRLDAAKIMQQLKHCKRFMTKHSAGGVAGAIRLL